MSSAGRVAWTCALVAVVACGDRDTPCASDLDCRTAMRSTDPCIESRCDLMRRVCALRRADRDRDGYAPIACAALDVAGPPAGDCDDTRPAARPDARETCNGADDDCDGETDEEPTASESCPALVHATSVCRSGRCVLASCEGAYADCDGRSETGCESDLATDPRHCGECGLVCPSMAGGTACVAGECSCPGAMPVVCGATCVDAATSSVHCGGCDVVCRLEAGFVCIDGECGCPDGRSDCNGVCRDTSADPAGCGGCGIECSVGQTCEASACRGAISAIALGARHACVLRSNGRVACWGANDFGQLGNGSLDSSSRPRGVVGLEDAAQIAAGGDHTCARTRAGDVFCWGAGDGIIDPGRDIGPRTLPVRVALSAASTWLDLDVGASVAAVTDGADVVRWGVGADDTSIELVNVQLELGDDHGCVLETRPGTAACWGANDRGQLGRGTFDPVIDVTPARVTGVGTATTIAGGGDSACVILDGGRVRCWGGGRHTPTRVDERSLGVIEELREAVAIATSGGHGCAMRASGAVLCWGDDTRGQLGRGTRGPGTVWAEPVAGLTRATAIDVGRAFSCALVRSGPPVCWGDNDDGQLGTGTTDAHSSPVEVVDL